MSQLDWVKKLKDSLPKFLNKLKVVPDQPGRFLPCSEGFTGEGKQIALGFSCFALKIYYMLGLWEGIPVQERKDWIDFLKSFQLDNKPTDVKEIYNAFIDKPVIAYLKRQMPWYKRFTGHVFRSHQLTHLQETIIAETKQAIATLAQVGESADRPYRGFPKQMKKVENYLSRLDWSDPWGAGAQVAALAVFLKTQAPRIMRQEEIQLLLDTCIRFIEGLTKKEHGAYFLGMTPEHGVLINGAMKVLTALDWLEVPIHYPEKLIDTCLKRLPSSDGCHLVDAIYVIYRCLQQTQYKKKEVKAYCKQMLNMIAQHHNPDGGFSYHIGWSQRYYYSVPISRGLAESDIHGTCLLTWAIAMIFEIMNENTLGWRVIRP